MGVNKQYPKRYANESAEQYGERRRMQDQIYALQDSHKALQGHIEKLQKGSSISANSPSTIAGINVKAPTDALSLKNGWTIRYNSTSNQFEFGM